MTDLKQSLQAALRRALAQLGADAQDIPIQDVPEGKPGDYGTPLAFGLAKTLRKNPAHIAQEILGALELPQGVGRAEAVGPYLNFFVDAGAFVQGVVTGGVAPAPKGKKAIVEHTSVNPNKEAHVGHLRNICLGDSVARILKAAGYEVEIQNYIDDTGRQAAESLFAVAYFGESYDPASGQKYDHWLGERYVRLTQAKEQGGEAIEEGVRAVMHRLERGELRADIERVLRSQLTTYFRLGAEYDLLVWESDVVAAGFLARGLAILKNSDYVTEPTEGKYAGALVMDVSEFLPGLEEPQVVLVRSGGNAMYVAKDVGYHYWKAGMFEGLKFQRFAVQPSGKPLYTSAPEGEAQPGGLVFAHGDDLVNVIDVRQSHPQSIVSAALKMADDVREHELHHLAYEVVTLEGQTMSGRKGVTLSIDEAMDEAVRRARAVIVDKNPSLENAAEVAEQVGIGALRFGMLKSEARRVIDFRWEQAMSLQGDSAPYVQYAHARARSILRAAREQGVTADGADWGALGELEVRLARTVTRLPEVVDAAARDYAPHLLAQYALELSTAWNSYYNHKDAAGRPDTRVLQSAPGLREARLALVAKVAATLAETLELLGIGAPEAM